MTGNPIKLGLYRAVYKRLKKFDEKSVRGGLVYPFEFEKTDVLWDIIKEYGMTPQEIREAILAWAYTVARETERGETWEKLNEAFKAFNREMINVDPKKARAIYHL